MAYLVRKINKKKNIDALRGNLNVDELTADMPTGELRTTNGTLSTWIVESLSELNEAILAIAVDKDVDGKLVVRYSEGQIKDILKKAFDDDRVDISKAEGGIKDMFIQFAGVAS